MKTPLFDPDEDREYTEEEKWRIAYAAVNQYYDKDSHSEHAAVWLIASAIIGILVTLCIVGIIYWIFR